MRNNIVLDINHDDDDDNNNNNNNSLTGINDPEALEDENKSNEEGDKNNN